MLNVYTSILCVIDHWSFTNWDALPSSQDKILSTCRLLQGWLLFGMSTLETYLQPRKHADFLCFFQIVIFVLQFLMIGISWLSGPVISYNSSYCTMAMAPRGKLSSVFQVLMALKSSSSTPGVPTTNGLSLGWATRRNDGNASTGIHL